MDAPLPEPGRRQFLGGAAALAGLSIVGLSANEARADADAAPRFGFARLQLRTAKLDELRRFYADTLGLPVEQSAADRIVIRAGLTELVFESDDGKSEPFYHFAFNIPENKIELARKWQRERTPLLKRPGSDEGVVALRHWNAHSVYFHDPAGNIVEFIARHDLPNAAKGPFTPRDILYASEIGVVVADVPEFSRELGTAMHLAPFRGTAHDAFAAMGDEHALVLVIRDGRAWAPAKVQRARAHPVRADIHLRDEPYERPDDGYRIAFRRRRD